jgi:hypothetical protein
MNHNKQVIVDALKNAVEALAERVDTLTKIDNPAEFIEQYNSVKYWCGTTANWAEQLKKCVVKVND